MADIECVPSLGGQLCHHLRCDLFDKCSQVGLEVVVEFA